MADLANKCCLVTGGSKGIGKGIVESLAAAEARVFTCSRKQSELDEVLTAWTAKEWDVQGCVCDVKDKASLKNMIEKVASCFDGKLHVLVNNAGTVATSSIIDSTDEEYNDIMTTNVDSVYHLCRMCHPLFKSAGEGSVVNIGSISGGPRPNAIGMQYAMSKGAIHQITVCLANEWAGDNIRVNCVAPGYILTPLSQPFLSDKELEEKVCAEVPMRRIGTIEETADVVKFFCSQQSSYITGQVLYSDGGYSVRGLGY